MDGQELDPMISDTSSMMSHSTMAASKPEPTRHDSGRRETSDTSSNSMKHKHHEPKTPNEKPRRRKVIVRQGHARLSDILLAFTIVFVPMAGISLILLGLTFYGPLRVQFSGFEAGTPELPVDGVPPADAYYTTVGVSNFLAVGSWSSTVAEAVVTPFTLIFSFFIAQTALRSDAHSAKPSAEIRALLKTPWQGSWLWIKTTFARSRRIKDQNTLSTRLAGLGVLFALLLTILVIAGDQWLHYTTTYETYRFYDIPRLNPEVSDPDLSAFLHIASTSSYSLSSACQDQSDSALPCSLTQTNNVLNVLSPKDVYLLLLTGINRRTSGFQYADFDQQGASASKREASNDQIINHLDPYTNLNHSLYYFLTSAAEFPFNEAENFGIDYVASTTSMSTTCDFATRGCRLLNQTDPLASDQQLLYDCFPTFQGNLSNSSALQGIEAVRGWNSSFYEVVNGIPQPISLNSQVNPFTFSAVADLNSYPFSSFAQFDPIDVARGDVIDAGSDHLAFAVNCTSAIYDVSYSFIGGNISAFNATLSDPKKAAVIRAPLQAGFGANYLYQQATLSTLSTEALLTLMANAFSQAGMAGGFGAFDFGSNAAQRIRYDLTVTSVNKAALIFQATVCMLYAAVGLVIMVLGLAARRSAPVRRYQARLLPSSTPRTLSFRDRALKFLGFVVEDLSGIESELEVWDDEYENQRDRRNAEREQGVAR